jgi:hypothetical protein
MKKDAYYFPHYSNARNDAKMLKLRRVLGVEGYGIYFMLLEILREQTDFRLPLKIVEELEFDLRISKEKIISVITNFELFEVDSDFFFSPKLVFYLQPYIESSERARIAANLRWAKIKGLNANADANAYANVLHLECESECKESKVKESKVKESKKVIYPTLDECIKYFTDNGYSKESGSSAWYYYDSADWKDSKGNKVLNWKQKMRGVWFKEENKDKSNAPKVMIR